MQMSRIGIVGVLFISLSLIAPVNGDFIVFKVPTTNITFVLQGKATTINKQQKLMSFVSVSKQTFELQELPGTEVITLPSLKEMAIKKVNAAKGKEEEMLTETAWALNHGVVSEFHRGIDLLLQANASHPFGTHAKQLKEELAKPIPDDPAAEAALLKLYSGSDGKIVKSAHFMLLAPPVVAEKGGVKRKRPEARLEQLEQLLDVFVMKCAERGLPVHPPKARLQVAMISTPPSSNDVGLRTRPRDAAIHWSASQNVLFIHDGAKIGPLEPLKKLQDKVNELVLVPLTKRNPQSRGGAPGGGAMPAGGAPMAGGPGGAAGGGLEMLNQMSTSQLQKLVVTIGGLMAIGVENFELESISREAAYMFTNSCGVLPKSAPAWLRDGLAAYFELPAEMGWVKIGDVGHVRQSWYLAALQDPDRISMTDIVCGRCYEPPMTPNDAMRASTQSWALVHFLLQQHSEGIAKFLAGLQLLPPDLQVPEEVTMGIFDDAFGGDRVKLEESWREHMLALKAEYENLKQDEPSSSTAQSSN
ncbi:MAG: hypothetical protein JWM11_2952 [Planctomycetaceae bacterium]|nr:hypothetical protein [Planctomycetaceae bacterium]